ncbi:hypothetical protein PoB_000922500 [Plakobranchus ocellatus]|uniref:Uncharacterized protein n=1 Tax=Plakobranchus ocellatus TaxID=259542 RepID=A0AAV3YJP6_9GAST|nr:hypothetical protein PoB_000922500 [Plakobranchus ocellatus]
MHLQTAPVLQLKAATPKHWMSVPIQQWTTDASFSSATTGRVLVTNYSWTLMDWSFCRSSVILGEEGSRVAPNYMDITEDGGLVCSSANTIARVHVNTGTDVFDKSGYQYYNLYSAPTLAMMTELNIRKQTQR